MSEKIMTNLRYKHSRRILGFLLSLLLLISIVVIGAGIPASAEPQSSDKPVITVEDKVDVHRGQAFTVKVTLDENPTGLVALMLYLDYNKDWFTLTGVKRGDALSSTTFTESGANIETKTFLWEAVALPDKTTGVLLELTFTSNIEAPIGEYNITLTCDERNTNSEYGVPVEVAINQGAVDLIAGAYKVVYKNYDGTLLWEKEFNDGDTPSYGGNTPARPATTQYSYTFSGTWTVEPTPEGEVNVIYYVADYTRTPMRYQVSFIVDGEFVNGFWSDYGAVVDLTWIQSEKNHSFFGWYADANYTQPVNFLQMPDHEVTLYGYMQFNIREENLPQIMVALDRIENGVAFVNIDLMKNTGLSGAILTLDYNRIGLTLIGFARGSALGHAQFTYTNTANGYDADPFKFYWEHATNAYDTGTLLTLQFRLNEGVPPAIYGVTVTYDEKNDAQYVNSQGEQWYTRLEIIGGGVPIGKIYHWYEETADGIGIDVTTEEGQFPDVILEVIKVTHLVSLSEDAIIAVAGTGMELKDVYSIRLWRNGVEIKPNGKITIKIELTEAQAACKTLSAFRHDSDSTLTAYPAAIEEGFIVFETQQLGEWALIGNVMVGTGAGVNAPLNTQTLLVGLTLLATATMGLALIMLAKAKKKKQLFVYIKDE